MKINYYCLLLLSLMFLSGCATKRQLPTQIESEAVKEKEIESDALVTYCETWIGSPYKLGGTSKKGVDCSGFVYTAFKDLYEITLPRRSADMISVVKVIDSKDLLLKGDILFFNNKAGKINHVGIYLGDNRFVHSSSSQGVIISTLEETYWKNHYHCGGRLLQNLKIK